VQEIVKLFVIWNIQMWLEAAKAIDLLGLHVYIQIAYVLSAVQLPNRSYRRDQGLHQEEVSHFLTLCEACHGIEKYRTETPPVDALTGAVNTLPNYSW